jgi:hypothetical protein
MEMRRRVIETRDADGKSVPIGEVIDAIPGA